MRWCKNCRDFNTGWPFRCHYCGAGLDGRLCPSGHVNPPDASLVFCGECGKLLEQKWGAGFSIIPYALGISMALTTIVLATLWVLLSTWDPVLNALVVLAIVIFGFRIAFSIVPPWVRNIISSLLSLLFDLLNSLLRLVFGTGIKGGGKR